MTPIENTQDDDDTDHRHAGVEDLKRSIRFYEAGLGFRRVPYEPETIAFFDLGGCQLARFAASSAEVRAFLERALRAGATAQRPARATSWGGFSGYFADPDGHLWGIACDSRTYAQELRRGPGAPSSPA